MKNEEFKEQDDKMMEKMKSVRERRVAPEFLKGFAASVVRKIESREEAAPAPSSLSWRMAVPVFAVLVLAVVTVLRPGAFTRSDSPITEAVVFEIAQLPEPIQKAEMALADEIEALKELGAWTSEDEESAGVSGEADEIEEMLG